MTDTGRFTRTDKEWAPFSAEGTRPDFYVATDGDDSWSGGLPAPNADRSDGPLATIERAQEAVRRLKREVFSPKKKDNDRRYVGHSDTVYGSGKDILVSIRGGYYALVEPLQFGPEDGGERCETGKPSGAWEFNLLRDHFVTYAAYPGEVPVIVGGKRIESWEEDQGKWVSYQKGMKIDQLCVDGIPQVLARTPNEGFFTVDEVPLNTTEFRFQEGDIEKWPNMDGNRIILKGRWSPRTNSIEDVDEGRRIVKLGKPEAEIRLVPPRYYIENLEVLLDAPGEWYFDASTGKLSIIPEPGVVDPNKAFVVVPSIPSIVVVHGEAARPVRNLRFSGLCFQAATSSSTDAAVSFEYATYCELLDSKIMGVGGRGINLGKGSYGTRIYRNVIDGTGSDGIYLLGIGRPESWADIIDGTVISHNRLFRCGGHTLFAANALNTVISHNEVRDTRGRFAIYVGGWSNTQEAVDGGYRVEYNHVHHALAMIDDAGGITVAGQTSNSVVRANLINDLSPGLIDNVAFWFDNWSRGWCVEDNIYYNLTQRPMKVSAAVFAGPDNDYSDNVYRDNFNIEEPVENEPEDIIEGEPFFEYGDIEVGKESAKTGEAVRVSCTVTNTGATGIGRVCLFADCRVADSRKFPVVHNNSRTIEFEARFWGPGVHSVAIGGVDDQQATPVASIVVSGEPIQIAYSNLRVSEASGILPAGEELAVSVDVTNVGGHENTTGVELLLDGKACQTQTVELRPGVSQGVSFTVEPEQGLHEVGIGDADPVAMRVFPHHPVDIAQQEWHTYVATRSKPAEFRVDPVNSHFEMEVCGTNFMHAADTYGAIYLKGIRGNFVATAKVVKFSDDVIPLTKAGIFVRNDISRSYEMQPGSLGSVLIAAKPRMARISYDGVGDGCMHEYSQIFFHETDDPIPLGLKLVRHGDSFTSYVSLDGENWIEPRHTGIVPGVAEEIDIGLAAGSMDHRPCLVVFEDFTLEVEDEDRKQELGPESVKVRLTQ